MGYDLSPRNKEADGFHFGAFSWPVLMEACGYLFPCIHNGGQWYCVFGEDERMPEGDNYPRLLSNDGFHVTAEEARIMARIARNYVAVQRSLPEENQDPSLIAGRQDSITRDDLIAALHQTMSGGTKEPWPRKIRADFVDRFEQFADWAEKSGGFSIW